MPDCIVTFANVCKDFGGNPVFDEVTFEIIEGQRIGLVGENGTGKSTLFKLFSGLDTPTKGQITRRRNLMIGYLTQEVDPHMERKTIFEAVSETSPELVGLPRILARLEAQMADPLVAADEERMTMSAGSVWQGAGAL